MDPLRAMSIRDLKQLLKIYNIKTKQLYIPESSAASAQTTSEHLSPINEESKQISKLNKNEIIKVLRSHFSVKKIQKFLRLKWSIESICPVSLETVNYPLFAFKPKGNRHFIYYNLEIFSNYLISTGDFRDPKTREVYNEDTLKSIDKELVKNKINVPLKGVFRASKNEKYYKNKKDMADNILVLDRCLDELISTLRSWVENRNNANINVNINILFMAFRSYFKRLCVYSKDEAVNLIKRTIVSVNKSVKANVPESSNNRDHIIQFLYQVQYDELEI